jgi:3',5'-cyclic AMP phosphodiesterase CpdA
MRVAILSDIDGNRTAFEAVLADLRQTSPDLILHGGDLADTGASPAEIVDRIRDLGWQGVVGNTDKMLFRPESLEEFCQPIVGRSLPLDCDPSDGGGDTHPAGRGTDCVVAGAGARSDSRSDRAGARPSRPSLASTDTGSDQRRAWNRFTDRWIARLPSMGYSSLLRPECREPASSKTTSGRQHR